MAVSINGQPAGSGQPGSYLSLNRKWKSGDRIEFTLPAAIRVSHYTGSDQVAGHTRFSVEYGPILLAAVGGADVTLSLDRGHTVEQLSEYFEPIPGAPLHFSVRGSAGQEFVPYWQVSDEEFTCYPKVIPPAQTKL
jgi:hypothetical protein